MVVYTVSVPGKVFALTWMQPLLTKIRGQLLSSFTNGRPTE